MPLIRTNSDSSTPPTPSRTGVRPPTGLPCQPDPRCEQLPVSKKQSAKSSTTVDHDAIAKLSWEQAIERLEEINDAIESGDLGLERSIDAYEEGVALRAHCEKILERAELRVTQLSPNDDDSGSEDSSADEPDEPAPF